MSGELAVAYAALILHDGDVKITADGIKTLLAAAGVETEAYWPMVFAKALKGKNVSDLVLKCGGGGGKNGKELPWCNGFSVMYFVHAMFLCVTIVREGRLILWFIHGDSNLCTHPIHMIMKQEELLPVPPLLEVPPLLVVLLRRLRSPRRRRRRRRSMLVSEVYSVMMVSYLLVVSILLCSVCVMSKIHSCCL
jgi:hypothetical protein